MLYKFVYPMLCGDKMMKIIAFQIEGRRCDRCEENTRSKPDQQGQKICEPCDDCYNLVRVYSVLNNKTHYAAMYIYTT